MIRFTFLTIIASAVFVSSRAAAGDIFSHIYRVATTRNGASPIELSGFKVKGRKGLYTALHGVVGCKTIRAYQHQGKVTGYEMKIEEVDVERDVAYLLPIDEHLTLPEGGLALGFPRDLEGLESLSDKPVKVYGYPMGIDELASAMKLTVSDPAFSTLGQRCPAHAKPALNERESPALDIRVLRLDGNLLPGHSGAAVLDTDEAVLAIGNGGLDNGRVGMGWGILFQDIKLTPSADAPISSKLEQLAKAPVDYKLFCVLNDDARDWFKHVRPVTTTVIASRDGGPVLASKLTPKEAIDKYMHILRDTLQGKDRYEEARRLFGSNTVPLANGTAVEVKEVAQAAADVSAAPDFLFPKVPERGKAHDPLEGINKLLSTSAESMNVNVKVLSGPHKGKVLWVPSELLKRETVASHDN